jgi:excisionase family DNA binding protein
MPVNEKEIYTLEETQSLLKVSRSTVLRLIKKGILNAGKIGGQYRILGAEILRLVLPKNVAEKIEKGYDTFVDWVKEK